MFDDKVAVVTGGATGIGAATATLLAERGAHVVVAGIQPLATLEAFCAKLRELGGKASAVQCDVADTASVDTLFAQVEETHGRLDVLVNSAGVSFLVELERMDRADIVKCINVNLLGPILTTRAALPLMRASGGGAIVNIASGASILGVEGMAVYAATKAGLAQFTRTLAPELRGSGIRVNCVGPGSTRTEMLGYTSEVLTADQEAALARRRENSSSPYGNALIEPHDIAQVILFAASDASRAMQGSFLLADDGVTSSIRPPAR